MINIETHENAQDKVEKQRGLSKKMPSTTFASFKEGAEKEENFEHKLKVTLEFMKEALAQEGVPRFKDFWDAKHYCLPLFKEKMQQSIKEVYWAKYTELATEAKRLKEILEEQSTFALEQIELALKGLQEEISASLIFPSNQKEIEISEHLEESIDSLYYQNTYQEIKLLLNLTAKLKSLREEAITTQMRIRHKNRLLKEMSDLADQFIPRKKLLIKQISQTYLADVETFISQTCDFENKVLKEKHRGLQELRESIKGFQDLGKKLPLNSHVFSKTRLSLSACWEFLREIDRERKRLFGLKKEMLENQIKTFETDFKNLDPNISEKELEEIKQNSLKKIETLELGYQDKKILKQKVYALFEEKCLPLTQKKAELLEKNKQEIVAEQNLILDFKNKFKELLCFALEKDVSFIQDALDSFHQEMERLSFSKEDKVICQMMKRDLYEILLIKKENQLEENQGLLDLWKEFKEEIKASLEQVRKQESLSGLDFEKAIFLRHNLTVERERYDRIAQKIRDLEE